MTVAIVTLERGDGMVYGIGTYISELIGCLQEMPYEVLWIRLFAEAKEFTIEEYEGHRVFCFPANALAEQEWEKYFQGVIYVLKLYLDSEESIIFNFQTPVSNRFIEMLKFHFPQSKMMYILHYFREIVLNLGDINEYKKIIEQGKTDAGKCAEIWEHHKERQSLLSLLDAFVCLSDDSSHLLKEMYPTQKEKIYKIPNGLEDTYKKIGNKEREKLKQSFYIAEDEKVVLFVGRIHKIKGILELMSCFNKVVQACPDCRLVVVGGWFETKVMERCKNVYSKITFTGRLPTEELDVWYKIADIGILPSYYEECSFVGIEMMMYGLPIIASDGYSIRNMFREGRNAGIAQIGNRDDLTEFESNLADKLIELLKDDERRTTLGVKARECYLTHYSKKRMQEDYFSLFQKLSAKPY